MPGQRKLDLQEGFRERYGEVANRAKPLFQLQKSAVGGWQRTPKPRVVAKDWFVEQARESVVLLDCMRW